MASLTKYLCPAGLWTEIDTGGATSVRVQNDSLIVPLQVAVSPTQPAANTPNFVVLSPCRMSEIFDGPTTIGASDKLWARPQDHSGLPGRLAILR